MFIAEYLVCLAVKCAVFREEKPLLFSTEEVCLNHAEAKVPELTKGISYKYVMVRCVKLKGQSV